MVTIEEEKGNIEKRDKMKSKGEIEKSVSCVEGDEAIMNGEGMGEKWSTEIDIKSK